MAKRVPQTHVSGSLTATHMKDPQDVRLNVYEIGYLIASSVPEEKVPAEAEAIKNIITKSGATIIADELPHAEHLAYTMRKKTVSGAYDKYDMAYFGWVKFEVGSDVIESLKKEVEIHPSVLRMLMISTVKENTYLGKRASALIAAEISTTGKKVVEEGKPEEKKEAAPATIEEMDKSIDAMVKEV